MQIEGGIIQSASWTLKEMVTFDRSKVTSRDWIGYPILRFPDVPKVEVHLINRPEEKPLGAGEGAMGPTVAAIVNAVRNALGRRVRHLPLVPAAYFRQCRPPKNRKQFNYPEDRYDLPMVFEKRTPRQLCEQLKDPAQNGGRNLDQVLAHVREAPLVLWGWNPGNRRTPAPGSHDEFVRVMREWVIRGAACPE
jgi:hypothetical protein